MSDAPEQFAAIDLGSNSFHMVVARLVAGELLIQEGLSEKVQLAAGLDPHNFITAPARERALACLARFAQRIQGIPRRNVRVVGTNALRVAEDAPAFMAEAQTVLGHDIEIIAGREEARLIYLGVSHSLPGLPGRTVVVDIGGGSTELIVGEQFDALERESMDIGCVSLTRRCFADGRCTDKQFDRALILARQEVVMHQRSFQSLGWQQAVGASGSIKAIGQVCEANGWSDGTITLDGLQRIRRRLVKAPSVAEAGLKGLKEDRVPIFAAGVAILTGVFEQLGLQSMVVSSGALREGVLYDLLGRLGHEDVRERSIATLMARNFVDTRHAERVAATALALFDQVWAAFGHGDDDNWRDVLRWAALLHEVGLSVSHAQFHRHGAYLVQNSDLPGFSRRDQQLLAALVRNHRRKWAATPLAELPAAQQAPVATLCWLLRLATLLHHARSPEPLPSLALSRTADGLALAFPAGWLAEHPLTQADLDQEQEFCREAGVTLAVS